MLGVVQATLGGGRRRESRSSRVTIQWAGPKMNQSDSRFVRAGLYREWLWNGRERHQSLALIAIVAVPRSLSLFDFKAFAEI
ncbi:hypothetical protein NL676_003789 [Syzygium grande]|nr:hypothetical protein NL676_003789 [Syzygium grande]